MDITYSPACHRCEEHPRYFLDCLFLDKDVQFHFICFFCREDYNITNGDIIQISAFLDCNEDSFFPNYPVLQDQEILYQLKYQQEYTKQMIHYINEQLCEPKNSMNYLMLQNKQSLQIIKDILEKSKQIYREVSKVKELQSLVFSLEQTKGDKLHSFIVKHLKDFESNSEIFEREIIKLQKMDFDFPGIQIDEIKQKVVNLIEETAPQNNLLINNITILDFLEEEQEENVILTPQQQFELDLKNQSEDNAFSFFSSNLVLIKEFESVSLNFAIKGICDEKVISLSLGLTQLMHLKSLELNLSQNYSSDIKISEKGAETLAEGISYLKQLTHLKLNLNRNNIKDKGIEHLIFAIVQLQNLVSLRLSIWNNNILEKGAETLSQAFVQLKQLTILKLNFGINDIKNEGVESLCSGLAHLKELTSLKLDLWQNFNGEAQSLSSMFIQLNQLSILSLNVQNNLIETEAAVKLFKNIAQLSQLKSLKLNISYNPFGDSGAECLFQELRKLSLYKLIVNLEGNDLSETVGLSILSYLKEAIDLKRILLVLDGNNIEQKTLKKICSFNNEEE